MFIVRREQQKKPPPYKSQQGLTPTPLARHDTRGNSCLRPADSKPRIAILPAPHRRLAFSHVDAQRNPRSLSLRTAAHKKALSAWRLASTGRNTRCIPSPQSHNSVIDVAPRAVESGLPNYDTRPHALNKQRYILHGHPQDHTLLEVCARTRARSSPRTKCLRVSPQRHRPQYLISSRPVASGRHLAETSWSPSPCSLPMRVSNGLHRTCSISQSKLTPPRQSTTDPRAHLAYGKGEAKATPRATFRRPLLAQGRPADNGVPRASHGRKPHKNI